MKAIRADEDPNNRDWVKRTWDLPCQNVEQLREFIRSAGMTVAEFKELPVYMWNVEKLPWLKDL